MPKVVEGAAIRSPRVARVVREAEELFLQEGFLDFNTEELARRLRCSKRTLYTIAPDRISFFEFIVSRHLHRLNENMLAAAEAAPDWMKAINAILEATIRTFGPRSTQFVRDITRFPGGVRLLRDTEVARLDLLQRVVSAGIADGTFRKIDPAVAAYAIIGAARRLSEDDFLADFGMPWNDALSELFRLLSFGLLTAPAPPNGRTAKSTRRSRVGKSLFP